MAFLDILKENTEQGDNADEQFDIDFALMTGEVAKLLVDVVEALGGGEGEGDLTSRLGVDLSRAHRSLPSAFRHRHFASAM